MDTCVITGADGFVGRALCQRLHADGRGVRKVVRARRQSGPDVHPVGRIEAFDHWHEVLSGASTVVHLANRAHVHAAQAINLLREIDVNGTARLARAAKEVGVRRFVYLSSAKVHGEESEGAPFSERMAPRPADSYSICKWEAERELRGVTSSGGMRCVILRPPLVYGSGVKANFLALLRTVNRGWPLPLASVRNRRSLIYVDNLVDAIVRCMEVSGAADRTYLVSDGTPVSTPDLIRALARSLGRPARLFTFPPGLLEVGGALVGRGGTVKRLTRSLELDDSAIRRELDWTPPFSFDEGIRLTAEWYLKKRSCLSR